MKDYVISSYFIGEFIVVYCGFFREELLKECIQKGTELVQAIADSLFSLPSIADPDGPLVKLPQPTTKLPREKHVSVFFVFWYHLLLSWLSLFLSICVYLVMFCLTSFLES